MDREVTQALSAFEMGDVDGWPKVNNVLRFERTGSNPVGWLEADLTALPGWQRGSIGLRNRITAAARSYLLDEGVDSAADFGTNKIHPRTAAGYRALHLLAKEDRETFLALPRDVWRRWVPTVIHYPRSYQFEEGRRHNEIMAAAIANAPTAFLDWIEKQMDYEKGRDQGHLFVLSRIDALNDPALLDLAIRKLQEQDLTPRAAADLFEWCVKRDRDRAMATIKRRFPQGTRFLDPANREVAVEVAEAALTHAPKPAWQMLESLFAADPDFARSVLKGVAHGERADVAAGFSDDELGRLTILTFELFNPDDDPPLQAGASFVSRRESVRWMRDRLVAVLAERGSDEAIEALKELATRYPRPGLRAAVRQAQDAKRAQWRTPTPGEVVELAHSSNGHLILSSDHLHKVVLAALQRIQRSLHAEELPAASELWERNPKRPKNEEEISDWLARRLKTELTSGGLVIHREVQVAANSTGRGRGDSPDLFVSAATGAFVDEAETAQVLVEVKGIWNRTVRTDMADQLVSKYLDRTGLEHGIYLVLWFPSEQQDPGQARRGPAWTMSVEEAKEFFSSQAARISKEAGKSVSSFVLDGGRP